MSQQAPESVEAMCTTPAGTAAKPMVCGSRFSVHFGPAKILHDLDFEMPERKITCIVGPSGSGKSTLIRSMNRINEEVEGFRAAGELTIGGRRIYAAGQDVAKLRTRVGMVFQKPCIFPCSIFDNVLFGASHHRRLSKPAQVELVEATLRAAVLWEEVKEKLYAPATVLSVGQQQRLCIARTLAVQPEVLLLDEPTAALDPLATRAIEMLMLRLKEKYTIIFVTHNIQQAKRISDEVIFLCAGRIIEAGPKAQLFTAPRRPETREYLRGEYCDCV